MQRKCKIGRATKTDLNVIYLFSIVNRGRERKKEREAPFGLD